MSDYVCSNCGSSRIGTIQRGIDNWLVAQCYECGPKTTLIPDEDGTAKTHAKREKAVAAAGRRPNGSKKAIHSVLRPLVRRDEYRPKVKPVEAESINMWE